MISINCAACSVLTDSNIWHVADITSPSTCPKNERHTFYAEFLAHNESSLPANGNAICIFCNQLIRLVFHARHAKRQKEFTLTGHRRRGEKHLCAAFQSRKIRAVIKKKFKIRDRFAAFERIMPNKITGSRENANRISNLIFMSVLAAIENALAGIRALCNC